ncbi:hypothetical protein ACLKA6_016337 [Drosophila palustris]
MLLKDQPTFKEVAKVFIVGLALRSYLTDGDGQDGQQQQRRTCFGHELSRRICMLATSSGQRPSSRQSDSDSDSSWSWSWSLSRHRFLKFMSPERLKDYDVRNKQRKLGQKAAETTGHVTDCATKCGNNNNNNSSNNNNGGGDAQVATLKHN